MLCLVGRVTACPERSRMGERRFLVDRHWRVATAIAFDRLLILFGLLEQLHQLIFPHALAPVAFQNRFTGHARRSNFPPG